jgi:hypothetical protein
MPLTKKHRSGTEGKDLFALILVFVGQFLNDGKDILGKEAAVVNNAVVGVEQVELNALQGNGFIGVDEECHVTAARDALLNQGDQVCQQLLGVATIFSKQRLVRLLIKFSRRDKVCRSSSIIREFVTVFALTSW